VQTVTTMLFCSMGAFSLSKLFPRCVPFLVFKNAPPNREVFSPPRVFLFSLSPLFFFPHGPPSNPKLEAFSCHPFSTFTAHPPHVHNEMSPPLPTSFPPFLLTASFLPGAPMNSGFQVIKRFPSHIWLLPFGFYELEKRKGPPFSSFFTVHFFLHTCVSLCKASAGECFFSFSVLLP